MPVKKKQSSEAAVREIRRRSRRRFSAEEKIRVVLDADFQPKKRFELSSTVCAGR